MANPWDNDPIVKPTQSTAAPPAPPAPTQASPKPAQRSWLADPIAVQAEPWKNDPLVVDTRKTAPGEIDVAALRQRIMADNRAAGQRGFMPEQSATSPAVMQAINAAPAAAQQAATPPGGPVPVNGDPASFADNLSRQQLGDISQLQQGERYTPVGMSMDKARAKRVEEVSDKEAQRQFNTIVDEYISQNPEQLYAVGQSPEERRTNAVAQMAVANPEMYNGLKKRMESRRKEAEGLERTAQAMHKQAARMDDTQFKQAWGFDKSQLYAMRQMEPEQQRGFLEQLLHIPAEATKGFARSSAAIVNEPVAYGLGVAANLQDKSRGYRDPESALRSGEEAMRLRSESTRESLPPSAAAGQEFGWGATVSPEWWSSVLGEQVPIFAAMAAPGGVAGGAARAAGLSAKSQAAVQSVGNVASLVSMGAMEAAGSYESMRQILIEQGMTPEDASSGAAGTAALVGATNALIERFPYMEFILKNKAASNRVISAVRGAVLEGSTEAAQEVVSIMADMSVGAEFDEDSVKQILASATVGSAIGAGLGAASANSPAEIKAEYRKLKDIGFDGEQIRNMPRSERQQVIQEATKAAAGSEYELSPIGVDALDQTAVVNKLTDLGAMDDIVMEMSLEDMKLILKGELINQAQGRNETGEHVLQSQSKKRQQAEDDQARARDEQDLKDSVKAQKAAQAKAQKAAQAKAQQPSIDTGGDILMDRKPYSSPFSHARKSRPKPKDVLTDRAGRYRANPELDQAYAQQGEGVTDPDELAADRENRTPDSLTKQLNALGVSDEEIAKMSPDQVDGMMHAVDLLNRREQAETGFVADGVDEQGKPTYSAAPPKQAARSQKPDILLDREPYASPLSEQQPGERPYDPDAMRQVPSDEDVSDGPTQQYSAGNDTFTPQSNAAEDQEALSTPPQQPKAEPVPVAGAEAVTAPQEASTLGEDYTPQDRDAILEEVANRGKTRFNGHTVAVEESENGWVVRHTDPDGVTTRKGTGRVGGWDRHEAITKAAERIDLELRGYPETGDTEARRGKPFRGEPIRRVEGKQQDVVTGSGARKARYAVVEAEDLIPTHDPMTFAINPYGDINERAYHDAKQSVGSRETVRKIATNPDLSLLTTDTPTPVDGPPIIAPSGQVVGGNARTMGVQRAYRAGGSAAEKLKQGMVQASGKFGVGLDSVSKMRNPVIVRVLDDAGRVGELSRDLNESMTSEKSREVDASSRAKKVRPGTIALVKELIKGSSRNTLRGIIGGRGSEKVARAFVSDGVWSEKDIERFTHALNGELNELGKDNIEQVLLAVTLPDSSVVGDLPLSTRNNIISATGPISELRQDYPQILTILEDAAAAMPAFKDSGLGAQDYFLDQMTMQPPRGFGDPAVAAMAYALDKMGPKVFREALDQVAGQISSKSEPTFGSLVGKDASLEEVLIDALAPHLPRQKREAQTTQEAATIPEEELDFLPESTPDESTIVNPIDLNVSDEEKATQLQALSDANVKIIERIIQRVDRERGTQSKYSHKLHDRIVAKAQRPSIKAAKPWFGVEHVRDALRFKTKINNFEDVEFAIKATMDEGIEIVKLDLMKMLEPKEWGWRFAAIDLRMPNGQLVEFYMPFKELDSKDVKGKNHHIFEKWRGQTPEQINDNLAEYDADVEDSYQRYQDAWLAGLNRLGLSETAARDSWTNLSRKLESMNREKLSLRSSTEGAEARHSPDRPRIKNTPSDGMRTQARPSSATETRTSEETEDTGETSTESIAESFDPINEILAGMQEELASVEQSQKTDDESDGRVMDFDTPPNPKHLAAGQKLGWGYGALLQFGPDLLQELVEDRRKPAITAIESPGAGAQRYAVEGLGRKLWYLPKGDNLAVTVSLRSVDLAKGEVTIKLDNGTHLAVQANSERLGKLSGVDEYTSPNGWIIDDRTEKQRRNVFENMATSAKPKTKTKPKKTIKKKTTIKTAPPKKADAHKAIAAVWDKELTPQGRRNLIAQLNLKISDKVLWQHLDPAVRRTLVATEKADGLVSRADPPATPRGTSAPFDIIINEVNLKDEAKAQEAAAKARKAAAAAADPEAAATSKGKKARQELNDLFAEFGKMSTDKLAANQPLDPQIYRMVGRIIAKGVEAGIYTFADLMGAFHGFLKKQYGATQARQMLTEAAPAIEQAWPVMQKSLPKLENAGQVASVLDTLEGESEAGDASESGSNRGRDDRVSGDDAGGGTESTAGRPDGSTEGSPAGDVRGGGSARVPRGGGSGGRRGSGSPRSVRDGQRSGGSTVRSTQRDGGELDGSGRGSRTGRSEDVTAATEETDASGRATAGGELDRGLRGTNQGAHAWQDYVIDPSETLAPPAGEQRFKANVDAIRLLKTLELEDRFAHPHEKEQLAKYTGWGWNKELFNRENSRYADKYQTLRDLMTDEEFDSASRSTLNAHYTTPQIINAMWNMADRLGFKGGVVMEPAMGIGHFFGLMPQSLREDSRRIGVEMDSLSARISAKLYPEATVHESPYQKTSIPNNSVDMAISNVPFHEAIIHAKDHKGYNLHDYYFMRTIDKVKPGGLILYVTSAGTMNKGSTKVRKEIAKSADLVGAIRLPNNAFKGNANTEVTTDIVILRKKDGTDFQGQPFINTVKVGDAAVKGEHLEIYANEYFKAHPEMALGKHTMAGTMYSSGEYALVAHPGDDLAERLNKAIENLPENISSEDAAPVNMTPPSLAAGDSVREGQNVFADGAFYQNVGGNLEPSDWLTYKGVGKNDDATINQEDRDKRIAIATDWVGLRDTVRSLLSAEKEGASNRELAPIRKRLNREYDAYTKKWGALNHRSQHYAKAHFLRNDPDYFLLQSIEEEYLKEKKYTKAGRKLTKNEKHYEKGTIFTKRVIEQRKMPQTAQSTSDALNLSLGYFGKIDTALIGNLLGIPKAQARLRLVDEQLVFVNPTSGHLERPDRYLSGNLKEKLIAAEAAAESDPDMSRNVEAIKKAMPEPKAFEDITLTMRSRWIPTGVYEKFIEEELGTTAGVEYIHQASKFVILPHSMNTSKADKFKTTGMGTWSILKHAMEGTPPLVYTTVEVDGKRTRVKDPEATAEAQSMANKMADAFRDWLPATQAKIEHNGQEKTVQEAAAEEFNDRYNYIVPPAYNGDHLEMPGMSDEVYRKEFRMSAISRILQDGYGMVAHGVGFGKTYTLIASAMELKRIGLAKKPMIVVQKATIGQFAASVHKAYPGARVLVADETTFAKRNRQRFIARAATGEYDFVVVTQPQFDKMSPGAASIRSYFSERLGELEAVIRSEKAKNGKSATTRELESAKQSLQNKMEKMVDSVEKNADVIPFDELGVDFLLVDEAHAYKKIPLITRMTRVKGVPSDQSARAVGMHIKAKDIQRRQGYGRGVVFATGTPVTNTMAEVYAMLELSSPMALEQMSIRNFDEFAYTFGDITEEVEYTWAQDFRSVSRFRNFINGPQLVQMIRSGFDVQMSHAKAGLKVPAIEGGKPELAEIEQTVATSAITEFMVDVADRYEQLEPRNKRDYSYIPILTMQIGVAAALDPRLVKPDAVDDPKSKVNQAVDNVYGIWKKTARHKKTQVIFADRFKTISTDLIEAFAGELDTTRSNNVVKDGDQEADITPIADDSDDKSELAKQEEAEYSAGGFNLYHDIRDKLVSRGVPRDQIALIHDFNTDKAKEKLFEKVNSGEIRVIIGSTEKLGVGVNIQDLLYAAHHLDPPRSMTPAMLVQRDGRIIRQGNTNKEVRVIRYGLKDSMDIGIYQMLESKQRFIVQALSGSGVTETFEDAADEQAMSMAEIKARLIGDDRIIRQVELKAIIEKMRRDRTTHYGLTRKAKQRIEDYAKRKVQHLRWAKEASDIAEKVKSLLPTKDEDWIAEDRAGTTIEGKKEIGKSVQAVIEKLATKSSYHRSASAKMLINGITVDISVLVGREGGFKSASVLYELDGKHLHVAIFTKGHNIAYRVADMVKYAEEKAAKYLATADENAQRYQSESAALDESAWPKDEELKALEKENKDLEEALVEDSKRGKKKIDVGAVFDVAAGDGYVGPSRPDIPGLGTAPLTMLSLDTQIITMGMNRVWGDVHSRAAARWLVNQGAAAISKASAALSALVKRFGQGIRKHLRAIWSAVKSAKNQGVAGDVHAARVAQTLGRLVAEQMAGSDYGAQGRATDQRFDSALDAILERTGLSRKDVEGNIPVAREHARVILAKVRRGQDVQAAGRDADPFNAPKASDPKNDIDIATGRTRERPSITQSKALSASMKSQAKGARAGYQAGKSEERTKARQKLADERTANRDKIRDVKEQGKDAIKAVKLQHRDDIKLTQKQERAKARVRIDQIRDQYAAKKADENSIRKELIAVVKSLLPTSVQGRMLTAIKNTTTVRGLEKQTDRVEEILEEFEKRAAINKVKATLKRLDPKRMYPEFAKVIIDMQAHFDTAKMTTRTRMRLRKLADYITNNPDHNVPSDVVDSLRRIGKTPLKDMSVKEIEAILTTLLLAEKLNKLKKTLIGNDRARDRAGVKAGILSDLRSRKKLANRKRHRTRLKKLFGMKLDGRDKMGPRKSAAKWFMGEFSTRLEQLLDEISPALKDLVYHEIGVVGRNKELRFSHAAHDAINAKLDKVGHKLHTDKFETWRHELVDVDTEAGTLTLTRGELAELMLHAKADYNRNDIIMNGYTINRLRDGAHQFTAKDLDGISAFADKTGITLVDTIRDLYHTTYKDAINQTWIDQYGFELATIPNYHPKGVDLQKQQTGVGSGQLVDSFGQSTLEGQGFTKEKKGGGVIMGNDVMDAFANHTAHVARTVAYMSPYRNLKLVMGDPDVKTEMDSRLGVEMREHIESVVNAQVMGFSDKTGLIDHLANKLKSAAAMAILGLKSSTVALQPAGLFISAAYLDHPTDMAKGVTKGLAQWKEINQVAQVHSPQWRERYENFFARITSGVLGYNRGGTHYGGRPYKQYSMVPLEVVDKVMGVMRWKAAEAKVQRDSTGLKVGSDAYHEAVAREWERIINSSENTSAPIEMNGALMYGRQSPWFGFFVMFHSAPSKIITTMRKAVVEGNNGNYKKSMRIAGMVAASTLWVVGSRLLFRALKGSSDDDEKALAERVAWESAKELVSNMPILGEVLSPVLSYAADRNWLRRRETPVEQLLSQVVKTGGGIVKAVDAAAIDKRDASGKPVAYDEFMKAVGSLIETLAMGSGIPVVGPKEYAKIASNLFGDNSSEEAKKFLADIRSQGNTTQETRAIRGAVLDMDLQKFDRAMKDWEAKGRDVTWKSIQSAIESPYSQYKKYASPKNQVDLPATVVEFVEEQMAERDRAVDQALRLWQQWVESQ